VDEISDLNRIASDYHHSQPEDIWIENRIQEFEFPWIKEHIKAGMEILDLGIGDGIILNFLQKCQEELRFSLDVIEGSSEICNKFNKADNKDTTIFNDFFENFNTNKRYDLILMSHILEHVDQPKEILSRFQQFLTPTGKILGIVPNRHSLHRRLAVHMGLQEKLETLSPRDKIVGHLRVYSIESLKQDIEQSYLEISSLKGFFLKPLANSQLIKFDKSLVDALLVVSDELPVDLAANIGFVACIREF
jgi:2-polyprenyl-3-methyl-5-hydroxy-6-metoxy-1,4-benzoquinol methylase